MSEPSSLQRQLDNPENLRTILAHVDKGWYGRTRYGTGRILWLAERGWGDHPAQGEQEVVHELIRQYLVEDGSSVTVAIPGEGTYTVHTLQLTGSGMRRLAALRRQLKH